MIVLLPDEPWSRHDRPTKRNTATLAELKNIGYDDLRIVRWGRPKIMDRQTIEAFTAFLKNTSKTNNKQR